MSLKGGERTKAFACFYSLDKTHVCCVLLHGRKYQAIVKPEMSGSRHGVYLASALVSSFQPSPAELSMPG